MRRSGKAPARLAGWWGLLQCGCAVSMNALGWSKFPDLALLGHIPTWKNRGALSSIPQSPGTAVSPRGRVPPQPGCAISGLTKLSLGMILPLGSSGTTFFALILLGFAWIRSWSSRAARLDFTRGRRNFRLGARRGSSGKVGCLLLLFNQLERCRVELEVTGRGSRLVSGRGRIC